MASREDIEERDVEDAEAREDSRGEATAVEGEDSESTVVEVIVRLRAGWPSRATPDETMFFFLEGMCKGERKTVRTAYVPGEASESKGRDVPAEGAGRSEPWG